MLLMLVYGQIWSLVGVAGLSVGSEVGKKSGHFWMGVVWVVVFDLYLYKGLFFCVLCGLKTDC